jgi:hypothetical protein
MTFPAKGDQVALGVVTKGAPPYYVVYIEILRASALLTAPTVTIQYF